MPGLSVVDSRTAAPTVFVCSNDLEPAIWHELAVLADIEAGYRSSCEWLQRWQGQSPSRNAARRSLKSDVVWSASLTCSTSQPSPSDSVGRHLWRLGGTLTGVPGLDITVPPPTPR
jgi:hypothetical protein